MVEVCYGAGSLKQPETIWYRLQTIVKVTAVVLVKVRIKRYIMVPLVRVSLSSRPPVMLRTCHNNLRLKISLLDPLCRFGELRLVSSEQHRADVKADLRVGSLVCEVACMNQYVPFRELERIVVSV